MPARMDYSVSLNVQNYIAGVGIVPGQCAISNGTAFILATAANIAANPGNLLCVALTQANAGLAFSALAVGIVPPDIFNLGPGASQYAGLSAGGGLQRQATLTSAVGYVDASGTITFLGLQFFSSVPSANAITSLTGPVTATGPGAAAATLVLTASAFVTGILAITNGGTGIGTIGVNGTVLTSNGTTASWQAPAVAGITALTGDVTATGPGSVAATVARVNGATVPAAGALTTGNAAYVSGSSALTYSALNLAGGAGWVTGTLPSANQAAQTMGGDVTGTTAASIVSAISGSSPIAITPNALQWVVGATPLLSQADVTTNSATGALSTHRAQNATGTTSIGGSIRLTSGTGTTRNGDVQFYAGSTQRARLFEAQQHHFQLGDGGGDATALASYATGYIINDTTYGASAMITDAQFTFFYYPNTKGFLLVSGNNLGFSSFIIPMIVDGSGNAVFQRGSVNETPIANTTLAATADAAGTLPLLVRGFSGQTANLFTAQSSTPATVFEITASGNVGIGAAGSYGGGKGGATFFANASTAPTTTPTGGGVVFCQSGALKYIGSSGTITTLAPA